jgi:hypothetical protein
MAVSSKSIREALLRLRSYLPGGGLRRRYAIDEPPLRSELFSADQMEQHGKTLEVDKLRFTPCLPGDWPGFTMHYRYRETVYHIIVQSAPAENGETRVTVDAVAQPDDTIPLVDDHQEHAVEVRILVGRS